MFVQKQKTVQDTTWFKFKSLQKKIPLAIHDNDLSVERSITIIFVKFSPPPHSVRCFCITFLQNYFILEFVPFLFLEGTRESQHAVEERKQSREMYLFAADRWEKTILRR